MVRRRLLSRNGRLFRTVMASPTPSIIPTCYWVVIQYVYARHRRCIYIYMRGILLQPLQAAREAPREKEKIEMQRRGRKRPRKAKSKKRDASKTEIREKKEGQREMRGKEGKSRKGGWESRDSCTMSRVTSCRLPRVFSFPFARLSFSLFLSPSLLFPVVHHGYISSYVSSQPHCVLFLSRTRFVSSVEWEISRYPHSNRAGRQVYRRYSATPDRATAFSAVVL